MGVIDLTACCYYIKAPTEFSSGEFRKQEPLQFFKWCDTNW